MPGGDDFSETVYAIGDVHGRRDLLAPLLDALKREADRRNESPRFVFLGDIIDRGPESRQALDLVMETLREFPASTLILGNHEEFLLRFLESSDRARIAETWFQNGGVATLQSYGFAPESRIDTVAGEFNEQFGAHVECLEAASHMVETRDYLFVHGGIDPHLPLARQDPVTTRWIREEFLEYAGPLPKIVVHGHTPTASNLPEVHTSRIALDTGAFFSNRLTAAILETGPEAPVFLTAEGHGRRTMTEKFQMAE